MDDDRDNLIVRSNALVTAAREAHLKFLTTELQVANTMLDSASLALDSETRERRHTSARDACGTVARYLSGEASQHELSVEQRDELTSGLSRLQQRFTDLR